MWQAIHLSCQHVIFTTFKPHVKRLYSVSGEGDLGRNQLTYPETAGECMENPQWEQQMQETGKNERPASATGIKKKMSHCSEKETKLTYFFKKMKETKIFR